MIELNGIQLDKTSAVPLYEQLRKALLEAITSGKLSAGTKLPTEEELCAQFGISRPVARQAYNMLIEDGFVHDFGKQGTAGGRRPNIYGLNPYALASPPLSSHLPLPEEASLMRIPMLGRTFSCFAILAIRRNSFIFSTTRKMRFPIFCASRANSI